MQVPSGPTQVAKTGLKRVNLRTAPCTGCKILVVFGQRRCLACGQQFNYGANPPPEPSEAVMQAAYQQALAQSAVPSRKNQTLEIDGAQQERLRAHLQARADSQPNAGAPVPKTPAPTVSSGIAPTSDADLQASLQAQVMAQLDAQAQIDGQLSGQPQAATAAATPDASFIDRGRYEATGPAVASEDIPGFIDSSLFAAFTPAVVDSTPIAGLEGTGYAPVEIAPSGPAVGVETTSHQAVGEVAGEDIPGFIDSTLFKAFTPDVVTTEAVVGLVENPSKLRSFARAPAAGEDAVIRCSACGTAAADDATRCTACGAPVASD